MKRLSAILLTSLLLFLVCNVVIVNDVHASAEDEYGFINIIDFEELNAGVTSGHSENATLVHTVNGSVTDSTAIHGQRTFCFDTKKGSALIEFDSALNVKNISWTAKIEGDDRYYYFYLNDTNGNTIVKLIARMHVHNYCRYLYVDYVAGNHTYNAITLEEDDIHPRWNFTVINNGTTWGIHVEKFGEPSCCADDYGNSFYSADVSLDNVKYFYIEMPETQWANYWDYLRAYAKGLGGLQAIPDYSDKWLHFGDVDASAFYFVKNYKYCEAQRNIPMNVIVKCIQIAFDGENQNFSGKSDLDLYFSGIHLGHPDRLFKCHGTYNTICLAEWLNLDIYLYDEKPTIELKCTWQKNGYYYNGLGIFDKDVDNDGTKNINFHDIDSVYGNGVAEGSTNIKYDLAYRVWYVLQGYEVNDSIVCQKDTVQYYDTIAISYSANIEETTYLIIYNASDDEVLNVTLSNVQGKIFFTPTEDMGTGTYTASLVRGGTKVANDTFNVVEGNTQYAVWVDKNSVLPNEQFTIFYKLPEDEYGQIDILRGDTVVYSTDVEGSTNVQTLTYSNDNAGMYTIKLYRNLNGTLYLKDDEIVTIGEGYYINIINVDKTKLSEGDTVKIYGTHQYAGYNVYVLIQPGGLVYDVSNSNSFEIDFKATQSADYVAYLMLDNQILDSVSFTVAPAGTYEKNPLVENFNYILAVAIIVIFAILGVAISNKAHITASHKWFVTAIFVLIGLFICIVYNLIPLWIPFLVALVLVAYIIKEVL